MDINKLNDAELYQYCSNLGKQVLVARSKFVGTLPEVYRRKLHKRYRFASIHEFAGKLAGISNETVDKVIILDRKLTLYPKLRELLVVGRVGWAKLYVIASSVSAETEDIFVEKVQGMSKAALEVLCKDYRRERKGSIYQSPEFIAVSLKLSPQNLQKLKLLKKKYKSQTWDEAFTKLFQLLEDDKVKVIKSNKTKTNSRYIPAEKRAEIENKFEKICAHPGCNNPYEVLHHAEPYSISKNHDSLVPLCNEHHEITHNSLYKDDITFKVNLSPNPLTTRYLIDKKYQVFKAPG
jgi:hypothetical protein